MPGPGSWFALYFMLALAGTWYARRYAVRRGLFDLPGERRSHQAATPRGGGLSIVVAMLVALVWLASIHPSLRVLLLCSGLGLLLVAGVGWLDDHRPLSAWLRIATHLAAALVLAAAFFWTTSSPVVAIVALVAVPVLVNVWNFMDGIDGIATSQAAIAGCAYALSSGDPVVSALAWALAAACTGFLPFNFPRATIFLGDVGSGALGYMLAVVLALIVALARPAPGTWLVLLLPLAVFLIDASLTLLGRMVRGERWWMAHVDHVYQKMSAGLGVHWPVTLVYAAWSICGSVMLLAAPDRGVAINIWLAAAWIALGITAWFVLQARFRQQKTQGRSQ